MRARMKITIRRLGVVAATLLASMSAMGTALAQQVAQQDSPYQPAITQVDPPSWLDPLGPLATLPVWAVAAVLAAVAAALVIVVPAFVRWLWALAGARDSRSVSR